MLLIHGSSSCGAEMAPLAAALRPYTSTTAPNLVGHGGRPVPESFSVEGFVSDIVAYVDREEIERTFVTGMFYGLGHPLTAIPLQPVARIIAAWMEKVRKA